ncbi:ribosomal-protein-alanine N-acetyltransferase [Pseudoalteromonas rubra]|uniref:Ribosomal-protein-alanine N-acetyltransferase n=1 Tax=Pseudoalteromonas rubra TaxID=43658 RepID=A0A8T0C5S2_9GAMM|nr:GNAT family N-acetyltransferase [Pseudoalteromonas rubra]KAF7785960.1 ribosomal-protein-alanine N-acetyltransferase [Pseudoalteromonas rubra]
MQIKTPRLLLRSVNYRDVPALVALLNDPLVSQYNDYGAQLTQQEVRAMLQADLEDFYEGHGGRFAIEHGGVFIGTIGLYDCDVKAKHIHLGIELAPKFWHQGLASEALSATLNALGTMVPGCKVSLVLGKVQQNNLACQRLLKHCGFRKVRDGAIAIFAFCPLREEAGYFDEYAAFVSL